MMLRHVHRFLAFGYGLIFEDDGLGTVSQSVIRHHTYHENTRGVDLPRWKTPSELRRMRIAEARKLISFARTKRSA
jgi:hypothetical protein